MKTQLKKVFKEGVEIGQRKTTQPYCLSLKVRIIKAYLKGDKSFKMLGEQYGIDPGVISRWVRIAKNGYPVKKQCIKITKFTAMKSKIEKTSKTLEQEIKMLKKQLEEEKLKTLIYEKVIEIAERDYKLDIIKKYSVRRPMK